ncbi:hypothetical protein AGLY_013152 [Aphis glycines]|uniref:Uncharacterized protein n=1 Tax=Aphis glycines TaxID=307491 RepID=A0A6G0T5I1_APHGL|nr:hypothetical protein AGLY_013152 [Aphis glycines]
MFQFKTSKVVSDGNLSILEVKSKNFRVFFKNIGKSEKNCNSKTNHNNRNLSKMSIKKFIFFNLKIEYNVSYKSFLFHNFFYKRLKSNFLRNMSKSRKFANYFVDERSQEFYSNIDKLKISSRRNLKHTPVTKIFKISKTHLSIGLGSFTSFKLRIMSGLRFLNYWTNGLLKLPLNTNLMLLFLHLMRRKSIE